MRAGSAVPRPERYAMSLRFRSIILAAILAATAIWFPSSDVGAAPRTPPFGSAIDAYQSYVGQSTCDPTPKPGVVDFRNLVLATYPGTGDYGISRDCNVGGQSEHKEGRAWDWAVNAFDGAQKAQADDLINWLLANDNWGNAHAMMRRLGIMYIIFNQQIFSAYRTSEGWRPYTGSNPHTDHVHFSFGWPGAWAQTTWWTGALDGIAPYPGFRGGAYVASGQLEPGGASEILTGAGSGGGPHVRALRKDGSEVASFYAYNPGFGGGVHVAAPDWDANGSVDIATGAGPGGGPHVRILNSAGTAELAGFFAYDPAFTGGVNVAAGGFDGDAPMEVATGAGPGGGPHVRIFGRGASGGVEEQQGFFAYDPAFSGGVSVAGCNVDGIPGDELVTGAGPGGGPHVRIFHVTPRVSVEEMAGFFAYTPGFRGGVNVACADVDDDGKGEIITMPGPGGGPHVRILGYQGPGQVVEKYAFFATSIDMSAGLNPAAGLIVSGQGMKILAGFGPNSDTRVVLREPNGAVVP